MINPDVLMALAGLMLAGTAGSGFLLWRLDDLLRREQSLEPDTSATATGDLHPAPSRV